SWARAVVRSELDGRVEAYKPPREDINSPDLYVPGNFSRVPTGVFRFIARKLLKVPGDFFRCSCAPNPFAAVMALVTYVLLVGIAFGQKSNTALAIMFFEVLLLKLGCYLLNISTEVQLLDLIAYSGYKFVG
ncbi:MAG: hypothetical protein BJ554DRAFT_7878, partial [Olpidium bornovanus]